MIGSIKFFIILALTLTRDLKDTLVVTQCGAEAIAFLKIYGVLPAAAATIALYSKLSNLLRPTTLFYVTCLPFFAFFLLFDLCIFPHTHVLHPTLATVQGVIGTAKATTVVAQILTHWTSALFYIVAEIYSSVSVGLLFWAFANDVVGVDQAKRFYPLFAQMSGLAPVVAGQFMVQYASRAGSMGQSVHRTTLATTAAGGAICALYRAATQYLARTTEQQQQEGSSSTATTTTKKADKPKLSMWESAKFLASSRYLRLVAILVLGYGLSINFTEIMWKSLLKQQYPNPLDYQRFMGNFSSIVGISTCIVIFLGVQVIQWLGWSVGAVATPALMALVSIPFFGAVLMGGTAHTASLATAVACGTVLSLLSKTSKYALFDPTTQMAYIPLDAESKIKGKAAIDVLGSRLGKSGGSLIQQGLVVGFGSILHAAPVVSLLYYGVLLTWIGAARQLAGLFQERTNSARRRRPKQE